MTGNLLITALLSGGANAGSTWLANDTFSGQGNIFIQDGFATYECWASVFETDSLATDGALTMTPAPGATAACNVSQVRVALLIGA